MQQLSKSIFPSSNFPRVFRKQQLPKGISQAATSQGYFPNWQFPICSISQAATSPMYFPKWQHPKCVLSQAATSQIFPSGNFLNVYFPKRQIPQYIFRSDNFLIM